MSLRRRHGLYRWQRSIYLINIPKNENENFGKSILLMKSWSERVGAEIDFLTTGYLYWTNSLPVWSCSMFLNWCHGSLQKRLEPLNIFTFWRNNNKQEKTGVLQFHLCHRCIHHYTLWQSSWKKTKFFTSEAEMSHRNDFSPQEPCIHILAEKNDWTELNNQEAPRFTLA